MENFNIITLIALLKAHKKTYIKTVATVFFIASVYAFSLPKQYTATMTLAPEFSSGLMNGSLTSLASTVGINLSNMQGDEDALSTEMYPDIVHSTPFLRELLSTQVTNDDNTLTTTLADYLENHQSRTWWGAGIHAITQLWPSSIDNATCNDPRRMSRQEEALLKEIEERVTIVQDKTTGLIELTVTLQDPYIASVVTDTVSARLQRYIYDYRTKKAQADLRYTQGLCAQALADYKAALRRYSHFMDTHMGLSRMTAKAEETELENDVQMLYTVYSNTKQQEAMAYAKVQSRTPVYNVVQPSLVPNKKSAPKRILIVFFMEFFVICALTIYLMMKDWLANNSKP